MLKSAAKLVCVPFAGAGASFYNGWVQAGFSATTVAPVMLPGRERLIAEAPFTDLHEAADILAANALAGLVNESSIVFGHCFLGSVLAYEIARRMLAARPGSVVELIVSASRVPAISRPLGTEALSDDAFLAHVKDTTGYAHEAMNIPEMRELLLPALRADFLMDETYVARAAEPLTIPITAISADRDQLVTQEEVAGWASYTAERFSLKEVSGGHMYLAEDPSELFDILAQRAQAHGASIHAPA